MSWIYCTIYNFAWREIYHKNRVQLYSLARHFNCPQNLLTSLHQQYRFCPRIRAIQHLVYAVWLVRTLCSDNTGKFSCITGDCSSSSAIECSGGSIPASPVTLVDFTLNGIGGLDYYHISLVYGFNLPVRVQPWRGKNKCHPTGWRVQKRGRL